MSIMAKDVSVMTIRRAQCHLCDWKGAERLSYRAANDDRLAHLNWHRLGEPETATEALVP